MILEKDVLVNNIVTELSDNSTGQISPYDVRHNLLDIIDSVHLLTKGKPLDGSNFGTRATRTTRVGEDSLSKIDLAGYFSIDNTAVGHSSLKSNYQGIKNTAVGSHSLFCNVYGENNAALGYSSLGGNTVGHGNVGLGNFSLNNNKSGSFNIAIGHGAGYYATNVSNKLFIASHNVDSNYVCENPLGSGLTPLVYGDFSDLRLGVATSFLHSDGALQVNGNVVPSFDNLSNLGSSNYAWRQLYLSSGIFFGNNLSIDSPDGTYINVKGDIQPYLHNTYEFGSQNNLWSGGYFNNVYVSGVATVNKFVAIENCNYFCKTINLASSSDNISLDGGGPNSLYDYSSEESPIESYCGYLPDEGLTGAGINIQSSGADYLRLYSFTFSPPNSEISCLQEDSPYSRSSWNSNISLHLASGTHLSTDRVIFPSSINIVNSSGCFGIFSRGSGLFLSENELVSHGQDPSGYLAGVGNVNFYSNSGDLSSYIFNLCAIESGVNIKQRFLNGIKQKTPDTLNNNADKLQGFEISYINNSDEYTFGPTSNRFVIGSYDDTSRFVNAITLMQSDADEGTFGITNLNPNAGAKLPATALNVRSANNAVGRFTAENQASTKAAIQLLGGLNCLKDGLEVAYYNGSGLADISMYDDSGRYPFFTFYPNKTLGLFTASGTQAPNNDMFTLGDGFNDGALISFHENGKTITSRSNHAKLYAKQKIAQSQSHSLFMTDGSGNIYDLVINPLNVTDGRGLYTDVRGNTFGGLYSPKQRVNIPSAFRNTTLGSGALFDLSSGDDNSIFGVNSASGITSGNRNTVIGSNNARSITNGNNNVVLGQNSFNNTANSSSFNIIIGTNGVGDSTSGNYRFTVGHGNVLLLDGVTGPNNTQKFLSMPNGGRFLLNDSTNTDILQFRANYIDVVDLGGNDYPNNTLTFTFSGNNYAELLSLNHAANPMTNTVSYFPPTAPRPYITLQGDLRLRGAIRFSDATSLSSANFLNNISNLESGLSQANNNISQLFSSFVEGYVTDKINSPTDPSAPTQGILYLKDQNWQDSGEVTLVNRDKTFVIHAGSYVIAMRVNNEYRPMWVSAKDTNCACCR
jgi:hypothetical protein